MTVQELGYLVIAASIIVLIWGAVDKQRSKVRARRAARAIALDSAVNRHPAGNLR